MWSFLYINKNIIFIIYYQLWNEKNKTIYMICFVALFIDISIISIIEIMCTFFMTLP